MNEPRNFMANTGWLSMISVEFRDSILERCTICDLKRGDVIYRAGDPPGGLWGLVSGSIVVTVSTPETGPALAHMTPGFWFGEGTVIRPTTRKVGAYATKPSTLLHIHRNRLMELLDGEPASWRWIALLSDMSVALAMAVVCDLQIRNPMSRTAATLLRMTDHFGGAFPAAISNEISIRQEMLADAANQSRVIVSQHLNEFARLGAIDIGYRKITILDRKRLSQIATSSN